MRTAFCTSAVLLLSVVAATAEETAVSSKAFVYKNTPQGELSLTAYFPPDRTPEDRHPAIVFFFGGGWTNGTPAQFAPQSQALAQRGMVAFCVDYRVRSRHGVTPDACVEDAVSAIRWVRQNAAILGVDPDRIVAAGGSAGGHLAACTGICPVPDLPDEDQTVSSRPNALVLYNPALNFDNARLLERIDNNADIANAISPTQHLSRESPPALLLYGTNDRLLAQGEEFADRAKALGHRTELYLAEGVGHGFFNRAPWQERTTQRVDEFLVSLGLLAPRETP